MEKNNTARKDITTSQDLSLGALSYTTTIGRKFKLVEVVFKFSVGVTETITITRDSVNGSDYDAVLRSASLVNQTAYVFRPESDTDFNGDELKVQCTNANLTGTAYVTIKTRELE